jgi:Mn-dependent DtxR family transcriptional regulator
MQKEKIQELLKKNKGGLTISDIAISLKTTRHTVSVALAELKGEKKIIVRNVGMAKLHYLN